MTHIVAKRHAGLKDALLGEDQRLDRREAALGPVGGDRDRRRLPSYVFMLSVPTGAAKC